MNNPQNYGQCLPSINLENINLHDHEMKLNSPRSLNIEIQQSHFFHEQGVREVLLGKLIRQRRELIDNERAEYIKLKEAKMEEEKKKKESEKKKNSKSYKKKSSE